MTFSTQAARDSLAKDIRFFRKVRDELRKIGKNDLAQTFQWQAYNAMQMGKAFEFSEEEKKCGTQA